jgi:putative transposase
MTHQIRDIEHKQTTALISTLHENGVQRVVMGDVRAIRHDLDVGSTTNQKLHQWSHGHTRHMLTYKAARRGMEVVLARSASLGRENVCMGNYAEAAGL